MLVLFQESSWALLAFIDSLVAGKFEAGLLALDALESAFFDAD